MEDGREFLLTMRDHVLRLAPALGIGYALRAASDIFLHRETHRPLGTPPIEPFERGRAARKFFDKEFAAPMLAEWERLTAQHPQT